MVWTILESCRFTAGEEIYLISIPCKLSLKPTYGYEGPFVAGKRQASGSSVTSISHRNPEPMVLYPDALRLHGMINSKINSTVNILV